MKFITGTKFNRNHIQPHERIMILGRTGTGKSVFADTLMTFLGKRTFIVLFDPEGVYTHYPILDIKTLYTQKKGVFRITEIIYNDNKLLGKDYTIDDPQTIVEFLAHNLYKRGNCILAIEELGSVLPKSNTKLIDLSHHVGVLITRGRKQDVGFIGIAQRTQHIHTEFLSQATHIISYEVSSKHDLDAMKAYIDKDKYENLKRFEFFHYNVRDNYLKHCYRLYGDQLYHSLDYYKALFGQS